MRIIANVNPNIKTRVTLTQPIADLCPHSHEPRAGSSLAITYTPAGLLLELHAIQEWIAMQCDEAIDLETFAQRAARDAAESLEVPVIVTARYLLRNGLELQCECQS